MECYTTIISNFVIQAHGIEMFTLQHGLNGDFLVMYILYN